MVFFDVTSWARLLRGGDRGGRLGGGGNRRGGAAGVGADLWG